MRGAARHGRFGFELRLGHQLVDVIHVQRKFSRVALAWLCERNQEIGANLGWIAAQHQDAVGQQHGLLDVVSHQKNAANRHLLLQPQFHQFAAQVFGGQHVQRRERLIHEKNLRFHRECARETDALFHAARKLLGIGVLKALQADRTQRAERAAMTVGMLHRARQQRRFHVFEHREPGEQREALKHDGDIGPALRERAAMPQDLAGRRRSQSRQHSQQSRFPRAGGAQQRDDHARLHRQVDGSDHLNLAAVRALERFLDAARFDDRLGRKRGFARCFHFRRRTKLDVRRRHFDSAQFVHQALPSLLGQLIEEMHALAGIHRVDNRVHLVARPGVQQNVGVIVGKRTGQSGGQIDG